MSALKHSVDVDVDPEFRMGLRAMLVAAAEREGIGNIADTGATVDLQAFRAAATAPKQRARRLRTRGAILAGVAVGAIAISGMSAASENAVPGDALYGVKRSTERAQLALASSDLSKGQLFLDFARNRLDEANAVRESDGFANALDDMDANTTEGVRLLTTTATQRHETAALDAIDAFLKHQRTEVGDLMGTTTGARQKRAMDSVGLLLSVEKRSDELRRGLECGADSKGSDALGPLPGSCPAGSAPADGPAGKSQPGNGRSNEEVRPEKTDPQPGTSGAPAGTGSADRVAPSPAPGTPTPTPSKSGNIVEDLGDLLGGIVP
ncbi:DUF5667 domain-containing protein [Asanoa iriomotensis]|uniref:DUF5667 domain-containing protein n=1 Tax=Asanoa iriomotensis TaxID=234613 RepID=A0ABQ4C3A2_9ACTN|nr:hypothetical protein Air01nite_33550 [Asanoa iriomotensis]